MDRQTDTINTMDTGHLDVRTNNTYPHAPGFHAYTNFTTNTS